MNRTRTFLLTTVVLALCSSNAAAQTRTSKSDPRILMALRDSLIMCEGESRFPSLEVAWKSDVPGPSDDPPDVHWSSAADSIASVKSNSQVTGRKAGSTHIIATVNWGTATASKEFPVKVLKGRPDSVASSAEHRPVCRD